MKAITVGLGMKSALLLIAVFGMTSIPVMADFFHYQDILVGDRAFGLGGAFTAVADDASAVHYNPAGLARISVNEVSGSATALGGSRTKIKGLFDEDYHERSSALIPVMIGGAYQLEWPGKDWVGGFGIFVPNHSSAERDEVITDDSTNQIIRWHHILKHEGEIMQRRRRVGTAFRSERCSGVRARINSIGTAHPTGD